MNRPDKENRKRLKKDAERLMEDRKNDEFCRNRTG